MNFEGLKFIIQYRRKDSGISWLNMAAFDGPFAAESYFRQQSCSEDWPWEYQMVDLESGSVASQQSPQGSSDE